MKEIELTQGQVALVDNWKHEELNRWKWYAMWNKDTQSFYAARNEGKRPVKKTIFMHRQIMNTPKGMECDHINHNTLDNQEHNLRNATHSQNQMNKRISSNNQLGEKCISPSSRGYRVEVRKHGERVFSKTFRTLDEAIVARDEAVRKFHGEFAYQPTREA